MNKKAFSMIEILISVSIIIILAIVATTTSNNLKNNSNNSKVIADLNTIENALVSFKMETNNIAMPGGNNNNFDKDWVYNHSFTSTGTYWVYGKFTENTLEKRFLDIVPLDPRTNQYYSYGITKETKQFELAWVIWETDNFVSKVVWDYEANWWIHSLIREYNGPNFISDKSSNLPYNPNDRVLVATDSNWNVYKKWDTINNNTWGDLEIFFSDGSTSLITNWTIITLSELDFPKENNLVSKVNLFLQAWSIWTKATKLDNESSFDIYTSDMTASVRWTVFKVEIATDGKTEVTVLEWSVEVSKWSVENWDFTVIDTIEVNELPNGDLENTEVIDSISETIINYTPVVDSNNMWFSHTEIINTIVETPIKTNPIKEEVSETYEPKNCYLEWVEVKNNQNVKSFKEKFVPYWNTCSTYIYRTCNDWNLSGNNDYKFSSCYVKQPNQCEPFIDSGFTWWKVVSKTLEYPVEKMEPLIWWEKIIKKKVRCNELLQNDVTLIEEVITCNSTNWFKKKLDNLWCECNNTTDIIQDISWVKKCITSCPSWIYIGWVCQDWVNTPTTLSWWTLNWVMPYDEKLNLKMYKNWSYINPTYTSYALEHDWTDTYLSSKWWVKEVNSNFYTKSWIKWIFMDTIGTDSNDLDYLKYWHYYTTNFGIEMNVFVPQIWWWARFLAQLWDLKIYIDDNSKLFVKYWWATVYTAKDLNIHQMNKILLFKEWNKYNLYINDSDIWMVNSSTSDTNPHLFIWSDSYKAQQFNSIIDYVKIYTK